MKHYDRIVTFDIETTWTDNPAILDKLRADLKPPGTHKKQETIDKWWEEEAPKVVQERIARTALDGMRGEVTAIGWVEHRVFRDGTTAQLGAASLYVRPHDTPYRRWLGDRLTGLAEAVTRNDEGQINCLLAGHNIIDFDLPFLWQQAIRQDLAWPVQAIPAPDAGFSYYVVDTMRALVGPRRNTISLADACLACGIEYDTNMLASEDMPQAWLDGDVDGMLQHLENDVLTSAQLALRVRRAITRNQDLEPEF